MQINNNQNINLTNIQKLSGQRKLLTNPNSLRADCFEKSASSSNVTETKKNNEVSFKGNNSFIDDIVDSLINEFIDGFTSKLTELMKHFADNLKLKQMLVVLLDKKTSQLLSLCKTVKIKKIFNDIDSFKAISSYFDDAGIIFGAQLENFLKTFSKVQRDVEGQELEALAIYGHLETKDDLVHYTELLLNLYNSENSKENPDFSRLNEFTKFLKDIGVNKTNDFDHKFEYLKPEYNNFITTFDIVNAISDLKTTYPRKIEFLSQILKENPELGKDAKKCYTQAAEFVDYFYNENNGENLNGIEEVLKIASQPKKIRGQSLKLIQDAFGDFTEVENRVKLFRLLSQNQLTGNDFSSLVSQNFVETDANDFVQIIKNRNYLAEAIASQKGISLDNAKEFYKRFAPVINCVYDAQEDTLDGLNTLIRVVDDYKITNSDGILRLFNNIQGTKNKTLSKDSIKEFIQKFNYTDSKNVIESAKKQRMTPLGFLQKEEAHYNKIIEEIDAYLEQDETDVFNGETAKSIYKKYANAFKELSLDVAEILNGIAQNDISTQTKYQERMQEIKDLSDFFATKSDFRNFIKSSEISFDDTPENKEYRTNCIDVLSTIRQSCSSLKSYTRKLSLINQSGFLAKSKNRLNEFLGKIPNDKIKGDLINIILEKQVPSVNALESFFKEYGTQENSEQKLLQFLSKSPSDITFAELTQLLNELKAEINKLDLPLSITADNIACIDLHKFKEEKHLSTQDITSLLNRMYNAENDENFLIQLPSSNLKEDNKNTFSANDIAQEIVFKRKSSPSTYKNIIRLLGLDKASLNVPTSSNDYYYISAIESVLPKEFVDFVNDSEWFSFQTKKGTKVPNIVFHARLRAIDRFALDGATSINDLYKPETKEKLQQLFKTVYTQSPSLIQGRDISKRIVVDQTFDNNVIEAVFAPKGEMITIVQKRQ